MKGEGVEKEKVKIKNILWEERFFPWNGSIIAPIIYKPAQDLLEATL